jgi:glycerophosphoryl diester phosphodiesterase
MKNIAIAYVGSRSLPQNKNLYAHLHKLGLKVMVATSSSYDKLETTKERAAAYRQIVLDGADIVESDLPFEVVQALRTLH